MNKKRVCFYIYDKRLVDISRHIPNIGHRAAVVQSLIATYDLFSKCEISRSDEASDEELLSFHSTDYLDFLKKAAKSTDLEKITDSDEFNDFNLGYDCPLFEGIYTFAKQIAGSSLTAAKKLVQNNFQLRRKLESNISRIQPKSYLKSKTDLRIPKGKNVFDPPLNFSFEESEEFNSVDVERVQKRKYELEVFAVDSDVLPVSVNWFGGWHHAQRDEAGGFCYVNDIVIAIQYLLKFYKRVLYIDLDIHHGNGVENAFMFSPRVMTFSMHKYEAGFYPASGSLEDVGKGKGKFYSVNVPLRNGITDDKYLKVFTQITSKIFEKYDPQCVVVQCGADCLTGDPLGGFNLTPVGIGDCLKSILNKKLPTMVLGGGGYNVANAARCWAYLTSVIVETPVSNDIPENSFLHLYGPEYELAVAPGLRKDDNTDEYLREVISAVLANLDNLEHRCPSSEIAAT